MLKLMYADCRNKSPRVAFSNGLTVVQGPVGAGKTMLMRDVLFLLLAGRVPEKRTLASLGENFSAGVSLAKGSETCTVVRKGKNVRIIESGTSGASAVKEKVSSFTGIASSSLYPACYASGPALQSELLSPSRILGLVRSFVGDGVKQFREEVSSETQRLSSMQLQPEPLPDLDREKASRVLQMLQEDAQTNQNSLQEAQEGLRNSRQILESPLSAELERDRKRYSAILNSLPFQAADEAGEFLRQQTMYEFAHTLVSKYLQLGGTYPEYYLKEPYTMYETYRKVTRALSEMEINMGRILEVFRESRRLAETPSVSAEEKEEAQKYIRYVEDLEQNGRGLQTRLLQLKNSIEVYDRVQKNNQLAEEQGEKIRNDLQDLELLRSFVLPSSEHSLERQMTEQLMEGVLSFSSDYLCLAGMPATLRYRDGMCYLHTQHGEVPAPELSGGELTLTALCIRLGLIRYGAPPPFLILDDVTGSLGSYVPPMCDMLRKFSFDSGVPVVLLTHSQLARSDALTVL